MMFEVTTIAEGLVIENKRTGETICVGVIEVRGDKAKVKVEHNDDWHAMSFEDYDSYQREGIVPTRKQQRKTGNRNFQVDKKQKRPVSQKTKRTAEFIAEARKRWMAK